MCAARFPMNTLCLHRSFKKHLMSFLLNDWAERGVCVFAGRKPIIVSFYINLAETWPKHWRVKNIKGLVHCNLGHSLPVCPPSSPLSISCVIFNFIMKCGFVHVDFMVLCFKVIWNFMSYNHIELFYWLKWDESTCFLVLLNRNPRTEGSKISVFLYIVKQVNKNSSTYYFQSET